jgi:hypothetical protein
MKKILPYIVFGVIYSILCFAVEAIDDGMFSRANGNFVYYVGLVIAALIALLAARRVAPLSLVGVLVVGILSQFLADAAIIGLLMATAAKAGAPMNISAGILSVTRFWGWSFAASTAAYILVPAAWLLFLNGRGGGSSPTQAVA